MTFVSKISPFEPKPSQDTSTAIVCEVSPKKHIFAVWILSVSPDSLRFQWHQGKPTLFRFPDGCLATTDNVDIIGVTNLFAINAERPRWHRVINFVCIVQQADTSIVCGIEFISSFVHWTVDTIPPWSTVCNCHRLVFFFKYFNALSRVDLVCWLVMFSCIQML
jgi:hypothetical protein